LCRNYLLKHVIEGKIEGSIEATKGRGRRHEKLLDELKETKVCRKLKEKPLDRTCGEFGLEEGKELS
jgi:hypothetical protein